MELDLNNPYAYLLWDYETDREIWIVYSEGFEYPWSITMRVRSGMIDPSTGSMF